MPDHRASAELPLLACYCLACWLITPPGCAASLTLLAIWGWLDPIIRPSLYELAPPIPPQPDPLPGGGPGPDPAGEHPGLSDLWIASALHHPSLDTEPHQ